MPDQKPGVPEMNKLRNYTGTWPKWSGLYILIYITLYECISGPQFVQFPVSSWDIIVRVNAGA